MTKLTKEEKEIKKFAYDDGVIAGKQIVIEQLKERRDKVWDLAKATGLSEYGYAYSVLDEEINKIKKNE